MENKMAGDIFRELWVRLSRHPGSCGKWSQTLPIAETLKSILVAIAVLVLFSFGPVQADDPLPKGEGRNLVTEKCQKCHSFDLIQRVRGSREKWSGILDEMANNGLVLNAKDTEILLEYLATHLGPSPRK